MNMKNLFYLLPLSLLIIFFSGCSDNDDNDQTKCECKESATEISGKWKLERRTTAFPISMNDYSAYDITIEIKSEKTLIVHEYTSREGLYFFEPKNYSITEENGYYTAVIDGSSYGIYIYENQLLIDLTPVDGPRYSFCCIKD